MTLYDFIKLDLPDRLQAILMQGTHLHTREEGPHYINLFDMGEFYGMVWFEVEDHTVERVSGFTSHGVFEDFVSDVDISILLNY